MLPGNYFGRGSEDVYLNSTNCTGSETDLTLCRSGPWYKAECEDDLVAAVDCKFLGTNYSCCDQAITNIIILMNN